MLVMSSFIYLRFLLGSVEVGIPLFVSVSKAQLPGPSPATNGWISVEGHPNALAIIVSRLELKMMGGNYLYYVDSRA